MLDLQSRLEWILRGELGLGRRASDEPEGFNWSGWWKFMKRAFDFLVATICVLLHLPVCKKDDISDLFCVVISNPQISVAIRGVTTRFCRTALRAYRCVAPDTLHTNFNIRISTLCTPCTHPLVELRAVLNPASLRKKDRDSEPLST